MFAEFKFGELYETPYSFGREVTFLYHKIATESSHIGLSILELFIYIFEARKPTRQSKTNVFD